jgi:hypothetical protein
MEVHVSTRVYAGPSGRTSGTTHNDCCAYHNGQPWMRVGKPSADKQSCENQGHVIPVGQQLKPDHGHPSYYCYDEPDKAKNQTKKLWCLQRPDKPQTDGQYVGRRFAAGIDRAKDSLDKTSDRVHQVIDEGAAGVPLHATTPAQEAADAGRGAIDQVKNITDEKAKQIFFGVLKATKDWLSKPPREQLGDIAEEGGDAVASPSTYLPAGSLLGKGGRIAVEGAGVGVDTAKTSKRARRAAKAAEHGSDAAAIEQRLAKKVRSLEKRRDEHLAKLEAYKKNPELFDNLGYLQNAPSKEVRERIIQTRVRHLEHEIENFEKQIAETLKEIEQ